MYCPICSRVLERSDYGELACRWGEMYLSKWVEQRLKERYEVDAPPQSPEPQYDPRWCGGIHLYCPRCGDTLDTHLECPRCHVHLRDLLTALVELHPHRPVETPGADSGS